MDKNIDRYDSEDEIDLLILIGTLYKHKWLIIGITLIFAIYIVIYSIVSIKLPPEKSFLPNTYTSKSTVLITDSNSNGGLASLINDSGVGGLLNMSSAESKSNVDLAKLLANSNTFLDVLAKDFNLAVVYHVENAEFPKTTIRNILRSKLRLEENDSTGTLTIGYEDIDKEMATKIANKIVELLDYEFSRIDQNSSSIQQELLEKKIEDVQNKISDLQQEYLSFQSKYNLINLEALSELLTTQSLTITSEIVNIDAEITSILDRSDLQNPRMASLKSRKSALTTKLRILEDEGNLNQPPLKLLPELMIKDASFQQNIQIQLEILSGLIQQNEITKLTDNGTGPTFQVLERAEVPEMKSGPSRSKKCVFVTLTGFFISIFLSFFIEFWKNIKKDPERMKKLKGEI